MALEVQSASSCARGSAGCRTEVLGLEVQGSDLGNLAALAVVLVVVIKADDSGGVGDEGVGVRVATGNGLGRPPEEVGHAAHEGGLAAAGVGGEADQDGAALLRGLHLGDVLPGGRHGSAAGRIVAHRHTAVGGLGRQRLGSDHGVDSGFTRRVKHRQTTCLSMPRTPGRRVQAGAVRPSYPPQLGQAPAHVAADTGRRNPARGRQNVPASPCTGFLRL